MNAGEAISAWCMAIGCGMILIGMPVLSIVHSDPTPWLIGWGIPLGLLGPPVLFVWLRGCAKREGE